MGLSVVIMLVGGCLEILFDIAIQMGISVQFYDGDEL